MKPLNKWREVCTGTSHSNPKVLAIVYCKSDWFSHYLLLTVHACITLKGKINLILCFVFVFVGLKTIII